VPRKPPLVPDLRSDAFGGDVDALAARAFGRAAGAKSTEGNAVGLLLDARENFPAWLDAIRSAQRLILFECYILDDDEVGREFARALADRARDGVQVYVLYDWFGSFRTGYFWDRLSEAGVRVAAFNPLQFASPLSWVMRDHRKLIAIDGRLGFVSGLCVSGRWLGNEQKGLEPWRDTGVQIQGPAVAELEEAFDQVWRATGAAPLSRRLLTPAEAMQTVGSMRVRVVSGEPGSASTYRLDLLIAALAHERLWLTDAYFVGTAAYVQALRAAAQDKVDVRLLVPGASDIPAVSMLSRAGYRALLDAGIRVFEWNGTMLHAKTAVADLHWTRIGSTNLNLASLLGNYELDVAIEDPAFAARMAEQFELDLARSTEIVLTSRNRVRRTEPRAQSPRRSRSGSAGRAAAGAISVGSALGAALTNRRALGPSEVGLLAKMSIVAIALSVVGVMWPQVIGWPAAAIAAWIGLSWMSKAWSLKRGDEQREMVRVDDEEGVASGSKTSDNAARPAAIAGSTEKAKPESQAEVGVERH
jgi:cardiolipin synthase